MQTTLQRLNFFNYLYRAFRGDIALWIAFWVLYVLMGAIQFLLIEYYFLQHKGSYVTFQAHNLAMDQFITLAFPWLFYSSLCVWACGKNSWVEWSISSKCIVIIPVIYSSFHLTNHF